jgi:hypothetical protein
VPAVAVAVALTLLAALTVAALSSSTAGAATVLHRGSAVAALAEGGSVPLAEGDEVPRGATVAAGRDGAVLRTRDRDTWLSGDGEVVVLDGARQELRAGFVMVDARRGPALELSSPAAEVTTPSGAVSRVERAALLRVGSYAGDPVTVRAAGRAASVEVPRARQAQVPTGGLPGRVTPLALTPGDAYERRLAEDLVQTDEALSALARQLDEQDRPDALVRAAVAADVPSPAPLPAGAPPSEQTLAYLLARAAAGDTTGGTAVADRFAAVRDLRDDGGSWGVVASLVDADVDEVAGLLDGLLGTEAVLAAEGLPVDVLDLLSGGATATAVPEPAAPGAPASAPGSAPAPGPRQAPAPAPAPAPPAAGPPAPAPPAPGVPAPGVPVPGAPAPPPTAPLPAPDPGAVDTVLDTVLGLLPPASTDSSELGPAVPGLTSDPTPSPSASPTTSGGLLGGLLGP